MTQKPGPPLTIHYPPSTNFALTCRADLAIFLAATMVEQGRATIPSSPATPNFGSLPYAMEGIPLDRQPTVLIVDRSDETLEVLQTALERRGLRTFAANEAERGLALARQHRPDLIVLDLEMDEASPEALSAPFAAHARARCTPLVMLGSARRNGQRLPDGEFVAKPYHYGPLIRKIEELLQESGRGVAVRDPWERPGNAFRAG